MNIQTDLLFIEDLSELEMEAISGGAPSQTGVQSGGLVQAQNIAVDVTVKNIDVVVAAQALASDSLQQVLVP